jgi:hypothetical protein
MRADLDCNGRLALVAADADKSGDSRVLTVY